MNLQKKAMLIIAGILFMVIGINSMVITYMASKRKSERQRLERRDSGREPGGNCLPA
jgi:hypothetical protein